MTGRAHSATVSRMMWIASASSRCRWEIVTEGPFEEERLRGSGRGGRGRRIERAELRVEAQQALCLGGPGADGHRADRIGNHRHVEQFLDLALKLDPLDHVARAQVDDQHPAPRLAVALADRPVQLQPLDRKSTRLNSSHVKISYAVF